MKRLFYIFLCCALLISCIVLPASAASDLDDGKLLDLLDYGNAVETETNYMRFNGSTTLTYLPPFTGPISYIDVVVRFWSTSSATLDNVYLLRDNEVIQNLKFGKIRGQYYRIFGTVTNRAYSANVPIGLRFEVSNNQDYSYISVESFNVGNFSSTTEVTDARMEVFCNGKNNVLSHSPTSNAVFSWNVKNGDPTDFAVSFYSYYNWQKFDYIDYTFGIAASEISSISVTSNGSFVPFEVSDVYSSPNVSDTMYMITVRVDQTNVDRSLVANYPEVSVWGNSYLSDENVVTLSTVVGHVRFSSDDPVVHWFKKTYSSIVDGFQSVVDAITGSNSDMDQTGQDMKDAADDLNEEAAAFDQIDLPDIDVEGLTQQFVNFSPSGLTVLATITSNPYVSGLLILVFTFALCAYVLFGKR